MKSFKIILCLIMLCVGIFGMTTNAYADYLSEDTLELEFTPTKVWMSGKNLCMTGTYHNVKMDRLVTKVVKFNPNITFKRADGTEYEFTAAPIKYPLCRLTAGEKRTLTYNFGEFNDTWHSWVADPRYEYQYRDVI
ncbi:MAG: hypothetical protein MJ050_04770 [Phascolarctobacterium sp.]|nr:hypothetical protein [Phascolarctobacterium sp.]